MWKIVLLYTNLWENLINYRNKSHVKKEKKLLKNKHMPSTSSTLRCVWFRGEKYFFLIKVKHKIYKSHEIKYKISLSTETNTAYKKIAVKMSVELCRLMAGRHVLGFVFTIIVSS